MARTYRGVELRYGLAQRLALTLLVLSLSATTQAEITVDGSLGSFSGSLAGPAFQIDANLGRQVGTNLLHSFGAFNINHLESATFTPNGSSGPIANVLGRVTGGGASTIDGTLRSTIPNANLFFFNPHGVAFGPHARLDVPGSFHVSTADYLRLGDGVRFDAQPSANDALLTTAPPAAFGFLSEQPAGISVRGSVLEFKKEGRTLSVVGGDFNYRGNGVDKKGDPRSFLRAPNGRINLASVASRGEVHWNDTSLRMQRFKHLGNIRLSDNATISTNGKGGGAVFIRAGRLVMNDDSSILAQARNEAGRLIDVRVDRLRLTDGSRISASTNGSGHGGNLRVRAKDIVLRGRGETASGASGLYANANEGSGDGGQLKVTAKTLRLSDGAQIAARTRADSTGKGGNITLRTDQLEVASGAEISASSASLGAGGSLSIDATDIELRNGGSISAESFQSGKSGTISIKANNLRVNDSRISVETTQADAGDIKLHVGTLLHLRDSAITTSVAGDPGNGGNIAIAPRFVVLDGSRIVANAVSARGGHIKIDTDLFFRTPDSLIEANSERGIPGTVEIKAPDRDVSAGLLALPAHFVDAAAVLTRPCAERYAADVIRLIVRKYEVLPDSPYALRVYLPSAGSDPNVPSDARRSSRIPHLHTAWDPRTLTCAFDLEQ